MKTEKARTIATLSMIATFCSLCFIFQYVLFSDDKHDFFSALQSHRWMYVVYFFVSLFIGERIFKKIKS